MLSARNRLSTKEVSDILKTGKKRSTKHFFLTYAGGVQGLKFGISAPKGGSISGVDRNRIRRRVYAYIETKVLPGRTNPFFGMVGVRKTAYTLSKEYMEKELGELFLGI